MNLHWGYNGKARLETERRRGVAVVKALEGKRPADPASEIKRYPCSKTSPSSHDQWQLGRN